MGSYSSEGSHKSPSCHLKLVVYLFVIKGVERQRELDSKRLERVSRSIDILICGVYLLCDLGQVSSPMPYPVIRL